MLYFTQIHEKVKKEAFMKYLIAWLLGVPIGLLIIIWLIFHIF